VLTLESIFRPFSRVSAPLMDRALKGLAKNGSIYHGIRRLENRRVRKVDRPRRILIIPDINIGDAVIGQAAVGEIRHMFPDVEISYAYQKKARFLIRENPLIDRHYPFIAGCGLPTRRDHRRVKALMKNGDFDLILIFSPYFSFTHLGVTRAVVIHPLRFIAEIIRAYASEDDKAHVAHRMRMFTRDLGREVNGNSRIPLSDESDMPHVYLPPRLLEKRHQLEKRMELSPEENRVLFNPDTSSVYTQPPLQLQLDLLEGLLGMGRVDRVLMNVGFTFRNIEKDLLERISPSLKKGVTLIPRDVRIDEYTALTDSVDIFISGDTGPMHLAASRKRISDSDRGFRNATTVLGLFGATSARIYGYDSFRPGFMPSAQDAPSRVFAGSPPCRDLTCIDKIYKRCPEARCFEGLAADPILDYVRDALSDEAPSFERFFLPASS